MSIKSLLKRILKKIFKVMKNSIVQEQEEPKVIPETELVADSVTYTTEEIQLLFSDIKPETKEFAHTYTNPDFTFRDESWEHIKTFLSSNKTYCWNQEHNSDTDRICQKDSRIEISSSEKPNNWNCLFYRKYGRYDFELSFAFSTATVIDEIQVSFNCVDLCRRCRFMIRNCETAVFEVVENSKFHRYLRQAPFHVEPDQEYFVKIIRIKNHYGLYIDGECLFFVEDNCALNYGGDIALVFYNRTDTARVNVNVSDVEIKTDKPPRTKVGILTYHRAHNYGAFLQAYCLYKKISEIDTIDCEIIDYRTLREKEMYASMVTNTIGDEQEYYAKQFEMFNHTADSDIWKLSENGIVSDDITTFYSYVEAKYDIVICGSDEIWRANSYRGFPTAYWLWGNLRAQKIGCAISMSDGLAVLNTYEKELIRENLKSFRLITCREQTACEGLAKLSDRDYGLLCDPTFTYVSPIKYDGVLSKRVNITNGKKNVLVMLETVEKDAIAAKIKSDLGDKYNLFSMFRYNKDFTNISVENPFEWAEIINEVDFVITNLYHGTIFSILSNTPFVSLCLSGKREKILSLIDGNPEIEEHFILSNYENVNFASLIERMDSVDLHDYVLKRKEIFEKFTKTLQYICEDI